MFWHNLSLSLGIPVEELKDRITAREVKAWNRYRLVVGPYGREREDYNAAMITAALYSLRNCLVVVNGGEGSPEPILEECCLKFDFKFEDDETETESDVNKYEIMIPELSHLDKQLQMQVVRFIKRWEK